MSTYTAYQPQNDGDLIEKNHSSNNNNRDGDDDDILTREPGLAPDPHDSVDLPAEGTFRRKVLNVILSRKCEMLLLILLVCDVILVMAELEIATKVVCNIEWAELPEPAEHHHESSETTTTFPPTTTTTMVSTTTTTEAPNPTSYGYNATLCREAPPIFFTCADQRVFSLPQPYSSCPFQVTEELPHGLHVAEQVVSWMSKTIIFIFAIELFILFLAGGPALFWHHKLYLLDAIVVGVSVIFDGVSTTTDISSFTELIVIARCWRFARIVHGVGAATHEDESHKKKKEDQKKSLDDKIKQAAKDGELGAPLAGSETEMGSRSARGVTEM